MSDQEAGDYCLHRLAHQKGKGIKTPRFRAWSYGDRTVSVAITPYGLNRDWETPYMKRIQGGECGARFEREIKTSPLSKEVKKNLISNMRRVQKDKRKQKK